MEYRLNKTTLLDILSVWNRYIRQKKIRLIACGGTALTLSGIKESTKDVDFLIPDEDEYKYLIKVLIDLGYDKINPSRWRKGEGFVFDLYAGKTIFTTELLESPLKEGNNILLKEYKNIYLGILNYYDLLISKLFRYTRVDVDDCLMLVKAKRGEIDIEKLKSRFYETSSYDISDEKNRNNFNIFLTLLKNEGFKI